MSMVSGRTAVMAAMGMGLCLALSACASTMAPEAVAPNPVGASEPATIDAPDYTPAPYVQVQHPDWARDAVLYQINMRQFTPEGTFVAAAEHLPRLADMGVDILWLMPVHPIGEMNRKGSLGSPYAVKDYYGVNPEFGTKEDLKAFIDTAHGLGMKVILDWVANHSAWDNALTESHPEWYTRTPTGDFQPTPWTDWDDIIDFDYDQPGLRQYMTEVMAYWVREMDVDGFRADVAGFVPLDFWETLRVELDAIKPVFMLAEWETRDMHQHAFDATYAWGWKEALQPIARGEADVGAIRGYFYGQHNSWPDGAYRMVYTSNHDQNAWDGAAPEIYGDALEAAIVFSFVTEGMPVIYNGQEAGLSHKLEFFEKDEIGWPTPADSHPHNALFSRLAALKSETHALWNGADGARLEEAPTSHSAEVFALLREGETDGVLAVFNFSGKPVSVTLEGDRHAGVWTDVISGQQEAMTGGERLDLSPWDYVVYRQDVSGR